ncbi:hypothetical protein [Duganella sp.]|uniref:hypothetical protein n=1 Tax=Duganella sp. TaxID=1904440 RepID=UPI0031CFCA7F
MASKPQLITGNATVINTGEEIILSLIVANVGGERAGKVFLTGATLGAARRLSPQHFPVFIGNLGNEGSGSIGTRFSAAGLAPGQQVLLTLRGTYQAGGTLGFVINRYLKIPAPAPYASPRLRAHVNVVLNNATWTYTLFNDEPPGSPLYIAAFHLDLVAPTTLTASPPGWQPQTDLMSYAAWAAAEAHIGPQQSLGGFEIQSPTARSEATAYSLISWDHARDEAGPVWLDTVLSPARAS